MVNEVMIYMINRNPTADDPQRQRVANFSNEDLKAA